jgi:hypothetical protein
MYLGRDHQPSASKLTNFLTQSHLSDIEFNECNSLQKKAELVRPCEENRRQSDSADDNEKNQDWGKKGVLSGINVNKWEETAVDRALWRTTVVDGVTELPSSQT